MTSLPSSCESNQPSRPAGKVGARKRGTYVFNCTFPIGANLHHPSLVSASSRLLRHPTPHPGTARTASSVTSWTSCFPSATVSRLKKSASYFCGSSAPLLPLLLRHPRIMDASREITRSHSSRLVDVRIYEFNLGNMLSLHSKLCPNSLQSPPAATRPLWRHPFFPPL